MLEVIAASLPDALAAEQGGADRLELVRDLDQDGLTPPLRLVERIVGEVSIPVRVMLRETPDFAPTGLDTLREKAKRLAELGVDGVVLGFLDGGRIDLAALHRVLEAAPTLSATFHRAFDAVENTQAALATLLAIPGVDRILTSGGAGEWPERVARLEAWRQTAQGRITILAGGGMDAEAIRHLRTHTSIVEFHIGRAARTPPTATAPLDAARIREFRAATDL